MRKKLNVLAVSGSLRKDSCNRKLLQIAKKVALNCDTNIEEVDLRKLDLPIFNEDIEKKGFPENVLKLKHAVEKADILLIASPEHNHSISSALKNAIDWISRGGNSLDGKVAVIFGVSDGMIGTVRGQLHLREILSSLNVFILPKPELFVRFGEKAFDNDGNLVDAKTFEKLKDLIQKTIKFAFKI